MAVSVTNLKYHKTGSLLARSADVVGDTSYPTGGSSLSAADFGLQTIHFIDVAGAGGYIPEYDYTNSKLKLRWSAGTGAPTSEITNATNVSSSTFRVLVFGV